MVVVTFFPEADVELCDRLGHVVFAELGSLDLQGIEVLKRSLQGMPSYYSIVGQSSVHFLEYQILDLEEIQPHSSESRRRENIMDADPMLSGHFHRHDFLPSPAALPV